MAFRFPNLLIGIVTAQLSLVIAAMGAISLEGDLLSSFEASKSYDDSVKLIIPKGNEAPVIDGKLDDAGWKKAAVIANLSGLDTDSPVRNTATVKTFYDAKNLYVAFECVYPPELPAPKTQTAEVFFVPPQKETENILSYQFFYQESAAASNRANVKYIGSKADAEWKSECLLKASETGKKWTVEFAIPFAGMNITPKLGGAYRMNFARSVGIEHGTWTPLMGESFLQPSRFNRITFGDCDGRLPQVADEGRKDINMTISFKGAIRGLQQEFGLDDKTATLIIHLDNIKDMAALELVLHKVGSSDVVRMSTIKNAENGTYAAGMNVGNLKEGKYEVWVNIREGQRINRDKLEFLKIKGAADW